MGKLEQIYNTFLEIKDTTEFDTFYMYVLYLSGGDFKTYSQLLNYNNYDDFKKDYLHFENLTKK